MEVRWQEMEDRCQEIAGRWKLDGIEMAER